MGARKETTTKPATRKDSRSSSLPPAEAQAEKAAFRDQLSRLYFGKSRVAQQFRYGLLVFDAVTITFIVGTSFLPRTTWLEWLDVIFGFIILTDFSARLYVSPHPMREFAHPATWRTWRQLYPFSHP
jgi:voltage-gated potassium channel